MANIRVCQEAYLEDRTSPSQMLTVLRLEGRMCFLLVKVKFTLEQATKAQRGSRGLALLFL
jgi:hypothetical protein